ncbi:MAG TPA: ABC transporter substrate-binding protein [Coriobacteriia bacterium]|nr:ABC transporter substrate-binding protein [Coriobacteriia bacterium]
MRGRILRLSLATLEAALAAALAVTLVGCAATKSDTGTASKEDKTPIKIGAVVSLTGTYAGLGEPEKNTIEMEVARVNEAGGVNGRPIEVIIEDDATDDAKANAAASKLIEKDGVVAVIGATGTGGTMAMRDVITRAGVPQVSMAGGTVITNPVAELVWATPWSNTIVAPFEITAMQKDGIKKVALISDTGGFGKDGRAVFTEAAKKAGLEIVSDQTFNPNDADMSAQLTNIKKSGAEAIVIWNAGKEASTVVKNAKDLGIELPLYGSHGNARKEFVEGAGDAAEGFRFAAGKILMPEAYGKDSEAYKVGTDFVSRYQTEFGAPPSTFAGHAYDALYIVVDAAKRVKGDVTPESLSAEIAKTSGLVGIGGTFTFSETDHNGLTANDLTLYEVKDGNWSIVQ